MFTETLSSNDRGIHRLCDKDCTDNHVAINSSIAACIRCHGNVFTELLPSNNKGGYTYTHWLMRGIYEVHLETGLGAMIYIRSFIKIGWGVKNLTGNTHTDSKVISYAYFYVFQNKKSMLKMSGKLHAYKFCCMLTVTKLITWKSLLQRQNLLLSTAKWEPTV